MKMVYKEYKMSFVVVALYILNVWTFFFFPQKENVLKI